MTNNKFCALGLSNTCINTITKIGFSVPTPVQEKAIPLILEGKDLLCSAPTGSGKTATYSLPLVDLLTKNSGDRALIIAPTRELAQQIQSVFKDISQDTNLHTALIVGGKNMQGQLRKLKLKPEVIIATPGRLNDHIARRTFGAENIKFIVWDEMDKMLELGMREQVEDIFLHLPTQKQSMMFSATFPQRVLALAKKYLNNPQKIILGATNKPTENVKQKIIKIEGNEKLKTLTTLLLEQKNKNQQSIVFVKTQRASTEIARYLEKQNFLSAPLHAGLKQKLRDKTLADFRINNLQVLVATDLASRGLDIPAVKCVINYELPQNPEEYVHRIGRTGRYNNKGIAYTLIARADRNDWKKIKEFLSKEFN